MQTDAKVRQKSAYLLHIDDSFRKISLVKCRIKSKRNKERIILMELKNFLLKPE